MHHIEHKQIDEVNMMFETMKTILITWLSQSQVKKLLKSYTHYEIRWGSFVKGKFVVNDLIMHDKAFLMLQADE